MSSIETPSKEAEHFQAFDRMMNKLFDFFGANYKSQRVAAIYHYLKPCSISPTEFAILTKTAQNKLESLNGNLGARLKDIYYTDVRPSISRQKGYDPIEDYSFPISNLRRGLEILRDQGEVAFDSYCKLTGMPSNDQDRVRDTLSVRYPDIKTAIIQKRTGVSTHISDTGVLKIIERGSEHEAGRKVQKGSTQDHR